MTTPLINHKASSMISTERILVIDSKPVTELDKVLLDTQEDELLIDILEDMPFDVYASGDTEWS